MNVLLYVLQRIHLLRQNAFPLKLQKRIGTVQSRSFLIGCLYRFFKILHEEIREFVAAIATTSPGLLEMAPSSCFRQTVLALFLAGAFKSHNAQVSRSPAHIKGYQFNWSF